MALEDSVYLGQNVSLVCRDDTCAVYKLQDETGEGLMTSYTLFPGISLLFNDFHIDRCISYFRPGVKFSASTIAGRGGWSGRCRTAAACIWRRAICK